MKKLMRTVLALLAAALLPAAAPARAADAPPALPKWEKDIRAFEAADKTTPPPQGAVLFIGSSSIRMWKTLAKDFPARPVINRGFGGSEICDSTRFAERIIFPYKPSLIVLGAGGNDIHAGKTPEQVAADFQAFVEKVRGTLPETRIAVFSPNPSPSRASEVPKQRVLAKLIREYVAAGKNLDYIDIFDAFMGADGQPNAALYGADRLHHNAEGYKIRADITRPHLAGTAAPGK